MKAKRIVTIVLLMFVGVSVGYLVVQESSSVPAVQGQAAQPEDSGLVSGVSSQTEPAADEPNQPAVHKLIAYYFHRTQRCRTCLTIEEYAKEALEGAFPEALKTGELEWRLVNLEEAANEHFVEDYELAASGLVLVDTVNGEQTRWVNLQLVWELVGDEQKFKAYVESEAMPFLGNDS